MKAVVGMATELVKVILEVWDFMHSLQAFGFGVHS